MKNVTMLLLVFVSFVALPYYSKPAIAGYLYGMDGSGYLAKISPLDGSYEFVSTNSKGLYGLTYVPEPATLFLFGLGTLMLRKKQ